MDALARQSLDKIVYLKVLASQLMQYIVEYTVPCAKKAMAAHLEGGISKEQALRELDQALLELTRQTAAIEEHKDTAAGLSGMIALYDKNSTASVAILASLFELLVDCFKYNEELLKMRDELIRR